VESPDSLLETTKEKGKNTLVESPGKLVRKVSEARLTEKMCHLRRIDSVFPDNGAKMLSHSL
jgi:hypothetical protein